MRMQVLATVLIISFVIFLTGCTESDRITGSILFENTTIASNQNMAMVVNLTYNPLIGGEAVKDYRVSVYVNGDHLTIYRDGQFVNKDNAEVVHFDERTRNVALKYSVTASYVSYGKYVETVTVILSTKDAGVIKTLTSDFVTIVPSR